MKVLLILPCTAVKPYSASPTWKYVLKKIAPLRAYVELAAIDCITNPKTGKPFGIVHEKEQYLTIRLDERPNPRKLSILIPAIRSKLKLLASRYDYIIAYINVKVYWKALLAVRDEFKITLLPSLYYKEENWDVKKSGIGPRGAFYVYVGELVNTLKQKIRV